MEIGDLKNDCGDDIDGKPASVQRIKKENE